MSADAHTHDAEVEAQAQGTEYGFDDSLGAALQREMQTAPWYMTSLAIHSMLFLLLLLIPIEPTPPRTTHRIIFEVKKAPQEDPIPPEVDMKNYDPPIEIEQVKIEKIQPILPMEPVEIPDKPETEDESDAEDVRDSESSIDTFENDPGNPAIMGLGGGPGKIGRGKFGRPDGDGGRKRKVGGAGLPGGPTVAAVDLALQWLAEHQEADGHWDCGKYGGQKHDVAVTSMALLAFLGNGNSTRFGKYKRTVRQGVYWLQQRQEASGRIGPHRYEAGIALMAMAEAYGMSGGSDLKRMAQKCVDYAVRSQCPAGAFDYAPSSRRNDTSVFGWWIMGLKSAKVAGLHVPYEVIDKALKYIQAATATKDTYSGSVSYSSQADNVAGVKRGGGSTRLTAVGLTCLQFLGRPRGDAQVLALAHQALKDGNPTPERSDFYRWYYAALGLFQYGIQSDQWRTFSKPLFKTLLATQVKAGTVKENKGSWNYDTENFGNRWGRVGQTALGALMLEVCYRYTDVHNENVWKHK